MNTTDECSKCDGYGVVDTLVVGGGGSESYAGGEMCPRCDGTGRMHDPEDVSAVAAFDPRTLGWERRLMGASRREALNDSKREEARFVFSALLSSGWTARELALYFGVTPGAIRSYARGRSMGTNEIREDAKKLPTGGPGAQEARTRVLRARLQERIAHLEATAATYSAHDGWATELRAHAATCRRELAALGGEARR